MFEIFETHIRSNAGFTQDLLKQIHSVAGTRKLRRRQFLLQEGEVCRHKVFVCKGLLKAYQLRDNGAEYIMRFAAENTWIVDHESYMHRTPSRYNIEAIEDTEVVFWSADQITELFASIPAFKAYSDRLISNTLDASADRILANISYTAEEKYEYFIQSFPDIFKRVPLHMVASYLGVSRETLSRVRNARVRQQRGDAA